MRCFIEYMFYHDENQVAYCWYKWVYMSINDYMSINHNKMYNHWKIILLYEQSYTIL